MKLTCEQSDILKALSAVSGTTSPKGYLPILKGCLLTAKGDTLTILATNLEQTTKVSFPAEVEEEGQIVTIHRTFLDLIRKTDSASKVTLSIKNGLFYIKSGKLQSKLHAWDAGDYPKTEVMSDQAKTLKFPTQKWKRFIEKVILATSPARMQYYGVFMEFLEHEIRYAATDGYRMAVLKAKNETAIKEGRIFIPAQSLLEVNKLAGDTMDELEITHDKDLIRFIHPDFTLQSRLLGSQFLDYQRAFPTNITAELRMNREHLLHTLQRATLFIGKQDKYAMAEISAEGDAAVISANATEVGSLREEIVLSKLVDKQEIKFNAKYLLDPLHVMDDEEVVLRLHGPNAPGVYYSTGDDWVYLHLISPVCKIG